VALALGIEGRSTFSFRYPSPETGSLVYKLLPQIDLLLDREG
jgi:hypothetical protein